MEKKTLLLDSSGDLVLSELKRFEYVTGIEKIAQDIWIILKTIKGSHKFNPELGVDYLKIIETGFNRRLIENEVRNALRNYPYIREIEEITISEPDSNRNVAISLRLRLFSGESLSMEVQM